MFEYMVAILVLTALVYMSFHSVEEVLTTIKAYFGMV